MARHPRIPLGMTGTIDVVHANDRDFWVVTDDGGFCGWTSYEKWTPVEMDVPGPNPLANGAP